MRRNNSGTKVDWTAWKRDRHQANPAGSQDRLKQPESVRGIRIGRLSHLASRARDQTGTRKPTQNLRHKALHRSPNTKTPSATKAFLRTCIQLYTFINRLIRNCEAVANTFFHCFMKYIDALILLQDQVV
jgi:hypothetical protein